MKENNLSLQEIQFVIFRLEELCQQDISTVKIKTICERHEEEETFSLQTGIEKVSLCQLSALAELLPHKNNLNAQGDIV